MIDVQIEPSQLRSIAGNPGALNTLGAGSLPVTDDSNSVDSQPSLADPTTVDATAPAVASAAGSTSESPSTTGTAERSADVISELLESLSNTSDSSFDSVDYDNPNGLHFRTAERIDWSTVSFRDLIDTTLTTRTSTDATDSGMELTQSAVALENLDTSSDAEASELANRI